MSRKFALIIGNTEYIDPGLAQLTAPGKDAEDLARVLKDQNLCGFDDVKVLLNRLSSSVIESIDEFFDEKKPDDMIVLYFSGHGVKDEFGSLYLAVKNTIRSRLRSTAIRSDYIREAMNQSRSRRQVIILDCCNSGAFPQGTKAQVGGTMGMISSLQGFGRYVLTASDEIQFAWEGDKIIGETDNSLFTHFLLKGLSGEADINSDGKITVDELYDYTYEEISKVTPKQTPRKDASKQEGEIVLRQITRIEDIKPVALPDDLISEIEDIRPSVREWAVQRLTNILRGKNIGMARTAKEALEKIATEDDSRRVSQSAAQVLESLRLEESKAKEEAERKAIEETEKLLLAKAAPLKAEREAAEEDSYRIRQAAAQALEVRAQEDQNAKAVDDVEVKPRADEGAGPGTVKEFKEKRVAHENIRVEQKVIQDAQHVVIPKIVEPPSKPEIRKDENKTRKGFLAAKPRSIISQPYFLPLGATVLIIVLASSIGAYYLRQNAALKSTPTLSLTEEPIIVAVPDSPVASQEPVATNIIPETGHLIGPADDAPTPDKLTNDTPSSGTGPEGRAPYGDSYKLNRLERPFLQEDMTYVSDLDIDKFGLSQDEDWYYISIVLVGNNPNNSLEINYGVEIDLNADGFGDYIIWSHPPYTTLWDSSTVQVFQDSDHDTGGITSNDSDAVFNGNGYDLLIFDGGSSQNDDPDLALVRFIDDQPATIQFAFKKSLTGTFLMYGVVADAGLKDISQFDYNDRFTEAEAGSSVRENQSYPLGALYAVDNSCWETHAITATSTLKLCPSIVQPTKKPSGDPSQPTSCGCLQGCSVDCGEGWVFDPDSCGCRNLNP